VRIVCDTNVLVSGILFQGQPRRILTMASRGEVTISTSPDLLREAEDVLLRPKFGLRAEQVVGIIALFRDTFEIAQPYRRVRAIAADPSDNMVLEAAAAASADLIVSGDKHLLDLASWEGIGILSPAAFVRESWGTRGAGDLSPGGRS
jgi:putative PIN family toxin of toxin-antitoxin system